MVSPGDSALLGRAKTEQRKDGEPSNLKVWERLRTTRCEAFAAGQAAPHSPEPPLASAYDEDVTGRAIDHVRADRPRSNLRFLAAPPHDDEIDVELARNGNELVGRVTDTMEVRSRHEPVE